MLNVKDALDIYKKHKPNAQITGIMETSKGYLFGEKSNEKTEALDCVDKNSGEISVMWIWDIVEESKNGYVKTLDITKIS